MTAAGRAQRGLPLQTLVDRDGVEKKALQIVLEEVADAGIEETCLVVAPGDEAAYRAAAGVRASRLHFVVQTEPLGYGHAVLWPASLLRAIRSFISSAITSTLLAARPDSAKQVADLARRRVRGFGCPADARERAAALSARSAAAGSLFAAGPVRDPPRARKADARARRSRCSRCRDLRAGFYLCFFGIHVLTPAVMEVLAEAARPRPAATRSSSALAELARRERYLALEVAGQRYNIGRKYGLLTAQLALALDGVDRERSWPRSSTSSLSGSDRGPRGRTTSVNAEDSRLDSFASCPYRHHPLDRPGGAEPLAAASAAVSVPRPARRARRPRPLPRARATTSTSASGPLFFLYAIHRFHLPAGPNSPAGGHIPYARRRTACSAAGSTRPCASFRPRRRRTGRATRCAVPLAAAYHGARVPDARRPGAGQRPRRRRQPLDVPHRLARRPPAAHPPRAARSAVRDGAFPVLRERTPGADGPVALVLERHLLPRHGLPRGGPRPERLDRPRASTAATPARGRRSRSTSA